MTSSPERKIAPAAGQRRGDHPAEGHQAQPADPRCAPRRPGSLDSVLAHLRWLRPPASAIISSERDARRVWVGAGATKTTEGPTGIARWSGGALHKRPGNGLTLVGRGAREMRRPRTVLGRRSSVGWYGGDEATKASARWLGGRVVHGGTRRPGTKSRGELQRRALVRDGGTSGTREAARASSSPCPEPPPASSVHRAAVLLTRRHARRPLPAAAHPPRIPAPLPHPRASTWRTAAASTARGTTASSTARRGQG
jgi:hypothetical protein